MHVTLLVMTATSKVKNQNINKNRRKNYLVSLIKGSHFRKYNDTLDTPFD